MRKVRRATYAVRPRLDLANIWRRTERELDRPAEVDPEPEVARLARAVFFDLLERVDDRRRDPARRADHVPHHREQADLRPVQTGVDHLILGNPELRRE